MRKVCFIIMILFITISLIAVATVPISSDDCQDGCSCCGSSCSCTVKTCFSNWQPVLSIQTGNMLPRPVFNSFLSNKLNFISSYEIVRRIFHPPRVISLSDIV